MKPALSDHLVKLQGYQLFRCDRTGRGGGGVAFYVSNALQVKIIQQSEGEYCRKPEFLIAEISFSTGSRLLLAVVYRPPHCGYLADFFNIFMELSVEYRHSIIFGDFNADMGSTTFDSEQILSFVESSSLFLVPYGPTHHLPNSSTTLDLCIIDDDEKLVSFGQQDVCFLSNHDLISIKYNIRIERHQRRAIRVRDFRSFSVDDFRNDLSSRDWNSLLCAQDVNHKIGILNNFLLECYDKHAPLKNIKPRHLPAPWLTEDIRAAMRERDRARRVWRRRRTTANYSAYKTLRNGVQAAVRDAKRDCYCSAFHNIKDPNDIWKKLRHLGLIKPKSSNLKLLFSTEELNDHFLHNARAEEVLDNVHLGDQSYDDTKFYWHNIETQMVARALARNKSEAVGIDGLTSKLISLALPCILPFVTHIYNYCISNSVYPDTWKSALICPLPKVKCPTNLQHYRPISILCLLSKALERIAAEQITHHLETFNLFDPQQTAYRRGFSTQTALIRVMDEVRHAADRRKVTIAVFFDFTKAFDNVNHRILIHKLRQLNFSCEALRWLCAYLDGRRQAVRDPVTDDKSSMRLVTRGVPQGSVLGPLLFVLYLSDFRGILEHCKYNFYADDLLIYLHAEPCDLQSGIRRVNEDIENVVRWADNNQLTLNANKTTSMILGTARYINNIKFEDLPGISVDNTIVPYKESVVYLGVTISQTLSWDKQVTKTVSKVNAALYQLKLCGHLFTQSLRARLVTTLIFPLIDYCCTILTDITGELNLKLQRACNASVRFVCRAKRDEHITPYYTELGWLKTNARRKYFVGCLTFNILQSKRPYDLFNTFTFRNVVSERNTRASSDLLALPPCRTELFRRSFRCCAPRLWNEIPSDVRSCSTRNEFKIKFFDYLLSGGN